MKLSAKQRKFLRASAHPLNAIVTIGIKGLSEAVKEEIDLALGKHELIKIKLPAEDKKDKIATLKKICADLKAEQVQLIGRIGVLYRPAKKPTLVLPKV